MNILGIIPARGGSRGIPRKNLVELCGKPLIAWTIEAARASGLTSVIVSTEDDEIASISRSYGANISHREERFASDDTPMVDVVRNSLWRHGHKIDAVMVLQPTCPLRTTEDIDHVINLLEMGQESVMHLCRPSEHPARMYHAGGKPMIPDLQYKNRQDLPNVYQRQGGIYATTVERLERTGTLFDEDTAGVVIPPERAVNIDNPIDLKLAEVLMRERLAAIPRGCFCVTEEPKGA